MNYFRVFSVAIDPRIALSRLLIGWLELTQLIFSFRRQGEA